MHVLYGLTQYETPGLMVPDCEWQDIIDLCDAKRTIGRHRDDKWQSGWLSPAILRDGATSRQITDVERMAAWLGLDVDHSNWSLQTLLEYLGRVECVVYSTTRSTAVQPRWRVLLPFSRETSVSEFAGVWKAINHLLDGEVDTKTRNANRLHYLPARWVGGNNEYHVQSGATLNVDELLAICPPEEPTYYTAAHHSDGVRAPDGTDIITEAMIDKHVIRGQAGGQVLQGAVCGSNPLQGERLDIDRERIGECRIAGIAQGQ